MSARALQRSCRGMCASRTCIIDGDAAAAGAGSGQGRDILQR